MRDFKGIKRQRNRNRNGGGGGGGGGSGKPQHNANRAFDSNGPDGVKVRGAAQHVYEKYQQLARDAQTAGDRVLAENHMQHAEHYFRLLRAMQPLRPLAEIIGRDQFVSGYDIDFEDESGGQAEAAEGEGEAAEGEAGVEQPRQDDRGWRRDEWQDRGDRQFRPREDRFRDDRQRRDDRPRDDRPRDDRPRDDRQRDDRPRFDRPREERQEFDRQDRDRNFDRDRPVDRERPADRDRYERAEARPRVSESRPADVEPQPAGLLRADDGDVSHAPAFLQAPAEPQGEARRPRRRRPARDAEAGPAAETDTSES